MWGRIVFGTDGSPAATRAGEVATTIARATSAKLIATSGYRASSVGAEERLAEALDVAEAAGMRRARLEAEVRLLQGDPAQQMLSTADDVDAELVVVGNRGLQGAKGFLLGSVPEKVVEATHRDVLVCRTVMQIASELGPGEGGVIERRGEKLAISVDQTGAQHLLSARCTHLGCTVALNPAEHTFDCPPHGPPCSPTR